MIVMRMKSAKVWAGNIKVEWMANLKRSLTLKQLMIAIKKMGLKKFHRHYLEILKFRGKVKLTIKLKDKIDNS